MNGIPESELELLAGAERRLGRVILLLIPVGIAVSAWQSGGRLALAFAFGGVLSYLNYRWIVAVVDTLVHGQAARIPRRTYFKLFLPLVLLGVVLYVILRHSLLSLVGVVAGLLLLVVAVFVEGVYEIFLALRK